MKNHVTDRRESKYFLDFLTDFFATNPHTAVPHGYVAVNDMRKEMDRLINWRLRETSNRQLVLVNEQTSETWVVMGSYEVKADGGIIFHRIDALYRSRKNYPIA